jgi:hypothetical protein
VVGRSVAFPVPVVRAAPLSDALEADYAGDAELEELISELTRVVPDPNVSNLIFWRQQHPLSRDVSSEELTAEVIVELAHRYKLFTR